jgi:hypothetical protein
MSVALNIFHGTVPMPIGPARENDAEEGALDTVTQDYLVAWPNWRSSLASQGVVKNAAFPGYSRMFVASFDVEQEDNARAIVSVRGTGLLSEEGDKRIREVSCQGRVVSIGPIGEEGDYVDIGTPSGVANRWSINEPDLSVSDTYFTTEEPDQTQQGTSLAPISPPTPPDWLWAGWSEDMRFNHPNGWVLDQRQVTQIVPGMLWAVRDFFVYYQTGVPA